MKKIFSSWLILRYICASLIALWGFILIFKNGINSGGRILLIMALIGLGTTILFELISKKRDKVNL